MIQQSTCLLQRSEDFRLNTGVRENTLLIIHIMADFGRIINSLQINEAIKNH